MKAPNIQAICALDPDALFTIREAARLLGYTYEGLRRSLRDKGINGVKRGRTTFIRGAFIQQQVQLDAFTME